MEQKKTKISYREFLNKEYEIHHAPYQPEVDFYAAIGRGDLSRVNNLVQETLLDKPGLGTLSQDPLRNMKYHFTISTASIARECIHCGLSLPESYSMSDYYIQQADVCTSLQEISLLHHEMCLAYTRRMRDLSRQEIGSRPILKCMDYIYEHLNTRITLPQLSQATGLSESYLSHQFKKETGYSISAYILSKKLETAKSMLSYSDYSIAEISAALAFPNQSYFSNALKKDCGQTPLQYRSSSRLETPTVL